MTAPVRSSGRTAGEVWRQCHGIARRDGLADAVAMLSDAVFPTALPFGPRGHAVTPGGIEQSRELAWQGGAVSDRRSVRDERIATIELDGGVIVALRCRRRVVSVDPLPAPAHCWARGLGWLRLGLSERLLSLATRHLAGRTAGDRPLLRQQLVQGMVADAVADQLEVLASLEATGGDGGDGDSTAGLIADLHLRITRADRIALRLLGASGFLAGGPGQTAYVSELLADAYLPEVS